MQVRYGDNQHIFTIWIVVINHSVGEFGDQAAECAEQLLVLWVLGRASTRDHPCRATTRKNWISRGSVIIPAAHLTFRPEHRAETSAGGRRRKGEPSGRDGRGGCEQGGGCTVERSLKRICLVHGLGTAFPSGPNWTVPVCRMCYLCQSTSVTCGCDPTSLPLEWCRSRPDDPLT